MNSEEKAAEALQDFADGPAFDAAENVAKAFELAGDRIAKALGSAAQSGELSFSSLAESLTRDLAGLAISELITSPLQQAIGGLGDAILGGGQSSSVNVNMNVSGVSNADSFTRSQGQISASLARAVSSGQRFT